MKSTHTSNSMPAMLILAVAAGLLLTAGAALKLPRAQDEHIMSTVQPGKPSATEVAREPNSSNRGLACTPDPCPVGQVCNGQTGLCENIFPCHPLPCPPGSVLENEPSCLLNADNSFNAGCDINPPAFSPMACGQTICGETWRFSNTQRDTDWYEIVLTQPTRITLILTTDFEGAVFGFMRQVDGIHEWPTQDEACQNLTGYIAPNAIHQNQACGTSITVTECFPVGRIFAFVGSIASSGGSVEFQCHRYTLQVQCPERPCSEACCFPDGTCQDLTGPECVIVDRWGQTIRTGEGLGTSCADDFLACQIGCATAAPIDCNSITPINNCDDYDLAPSPKCLEGDDTPPNPTYSCRNGNGQTGTRWFSFVSSSATVMIATCNSNPAGVGSPPGGGDSTLALYGGDCNGGIETVLTEIGCDENDCGSFSSGPLQSFLCVGGLVPGDTYYIQFSAFDDEARGSYDLELLCPCPALAPGPCCLPNGSCVIIEPDVCENPSGLNGVFQGTEVPGTNDCSDNDGDGQADVCRRGACCEADGTCSFLLEDDCSAVEGASWLADVGCQQPDQLTPNPCNGACCQYGLSTTCFNRIEANCTLGVQVWFEDEGCSDFFFECPDPNVCAAMTNTGSPEAPQGEPDNPNCQAPAIVEPDNPGSFASSSDLNPKSSAAGLGTQSADDFQASTNGSITSACFWGQYNDVRTDGGLGPNPPTPNDCQATDAFTLTYYPDANGCPDTANPLASFSQLSGTLTVTRSYTGLRNPFDPADAANGFTVPQRPPTQVWAYQADHAAVGVTAGTSYWIQITADTGDGFCTWSWETAPNSEGNSLSLTRDASGSLYTCTGNPNDARPYDLAFCLNVTNQPPPVQTVCTATAARSCAQHDCDRLCLDLLGGSNVENRIAGSTELEIDFATGTAPANPGVASIDCTDNSGAVTSHTASASASVSGDTVTVTFAPALPDQNACVITLNCGASVCIRMLQGDTNRNGTVTTGDFSAVRFWFNQTACAAGAEIDFNAVNGITTGDASAVRFFFNNTVPSCP